MVGIPERITRKSRKGIGKRKKEKKKAVDVHESLGTRGIDDSWRSD